MLIFVLFMINVNFTAIDFETAHALFPCEIGMTRVENGVLTETKSWLIKPSCFPYMNPLCQKVHGITSVDVSEAKTFEELWSELRHWLDSQFVVAHNAPFDMAVLRSALAYYDLAVPWIDYFCSIRLARKAWKGLPSYSLGRLCEYHGIEFHHHRAGDDSYACALLTLKALNTLGISSVEELPAVADIVLKRLKSCV